MGEPTKYRNNVGIPSIKKSIGSPSYWKVFNFVDMKLEQILAASSCNLLHLCDRLFFFNIVFVFLHITVLFNGETLR
jgi:hypothetical protein